MKIALESIDGLTHMSEKDKAKFDKTKIKSLFGFIRSKQDKIMKKFSSSQQQKILDQIYHIVMMGGFTLTWYILGKSPCYYFLYLFVLFELILIPWRIVYYYKLKWHFFMLDY